MLQLPREPEPLVTYFPMCPACWVSRDDGHHEDCELEALKERLQDRLNEIV
jgi:hypothetical protein